MKPQQQPQPNRQVQAMQPPPQPERRIWRIWFLERIPRFGDNNPTEQYMTFEDVPVKAEKVRDGVDLTNTVSGESRTVPWSNIRLIEYK